MLFSDLVYIFDFTTASWPANPKIFSFRCVSKNACRPLVYSIIIMIIIITKLSRN